jgi:hypothetical protein
MPASKAEQVLEALRTVLETVPDAAVDRNSVLPERIPDGGLIICAMVIRASRSRRSAASGMPTANMRSRSRSTSRRAMPQLATLPSTPCCSRSG